MNEFLITTDATVQFKNLSKEVVKEISKARKRGMNRAASKIKNSTRKLIRNKFPNAAKSDLIEGARVVKYKEDQHLGEAVAGAHIMGVRSKGSTTYKLRFFEDGSEDNRKTKKGYNRGKLKGLHFFKEAYTKELPKAPEIIDKEIQKAIEKINLR